MASSNPLRVLTADHDIRFNAVLDHWTGVGDFHAAGYRQAAEILLRRLLADPEGTAGERDSVVLPILFLFRHYLELRFKDIIVYGLVLSGQRAEWRHGHDLDRLWTEVHQLCGSLYGASLPAQFVTIAECVNDLCQLDPNSESFRYGRDRNGRPIFDHLVIGLKALGATVALIGDCLDGISMDFSVRVQDLP
ncbi:MAG: hypothetical protein AB7G48_11230 [Nitrospiraceae bacterium]